MEAEARETAESPTSVAAAAGSEGNGSKPNVRSFLSVKCPVRCPLSSLFLLVGSHILVQVWLGFLHAFTTGLLPSSEIGRADASLKNKPAFGDAGGVATRVDPNLETSILNSESLGPNLTGPEIDMMVWAFRSRRDGGRKQTLSLLCIPGLALHSMIRIYHLAVARSYMQLLVILLISVDTKIHVKKKLS